MSVAAAPPERLGSYRLLDKLGQGGMAQVFQAERLGEAGFKKRVAIKRMLPQYRRDPSLLERFAAEARTNARLDHPNLVQVLDFGIEPEPYLVLEFVEGVSLSAILQRLVERGEKLELAAAIFIAAEASYGLDHAHRKKDDDGNPLGIVHRDVSPQNILVSNEGSVKVSDFGLVKAADNVLKTASGVTIGKISYMAPEQADGREVDARADVFSLGVVLWEMLTLRSLIPADDPARAAVLLQSGAFSPPSSINPAVPPELDALVMGCLTIDIEQRMPSAQQLGLALREILHEMAAGYGKQQLARLLQWLFPERGWAMPEPELPPAQPTSEERMSMALVTPATVAMQRSSGPPAPPDAEVTARNAAVRGQPLTRPGAPSARSSAALIGIGIAIGVGGIALAGLVAAAVVLAWHRTQGDEATTTLPPVPTSQQPGQVVQPMQPHDDPYGVTLVSSTIGVRLFLGSRPIGVPPLHLDQRDVTGEPLVALAAGHQPLMIRAERLVELTRGPSRAFVLDLEPTHRPDVMVYVRYDGQGTAMLGTGEVLGPVPGVIRVPTRRQEPLATSILVFADTGADRTELPLDGCTPETICTLYAGVR